MMLRPSYRRKVVSLIQILGLILCAAVAASAQTVVYDWSGNSKVPESYPRITHKEVVHFNITHVNDILFTYRLEVTETPMDDNDFEKIKSLLNPAKSSADFAGTDCKTLDAKLEKAIQDAVEAISIDPSLPARYATTLPHKSVSLDATLAAWRNHADAIAAVRAAAAALADKCDVSEQTNADYEAFDAAVKSIQKKVDGPHVFVADSEISPGNNVSAKVIEIYKDETISSKTFTFSGTDVLTLSAGALFSRIPDQTYEARKSPNSILNVLTVEGNSRATPSIVALLNYSLGGLYKKFDGDNLGLALSAGPVIRLANQSEASSFGFFTGISGTLYHRFYITPGIHFGQFADFPVGFANGSPVPENFGQVTPVKRWTARFGLAFTFKTKDFSGLTSSSTPSVTGSEASPTPKPTPSPAGGSKAIKLTTASSGVAEPKAGSPEPRRNANDTSSGVSPFAMSSSSSQLPLTIITYLNSSTSPAGDNRISINASGPISNYATYFKGGRFYLVIPHARLDVIDDGLRGRVFSDPVVEKRGDDLVLSFVFLPGTRASVLERPDGLDLVLKTSGTN